MKVEIGAGGRATPGFLAIDVNPRRCDVLANATHLPFRDGSIVELRAVDVLEHLSYRDTDQVLAEWARVCAPGAGLYVQVPDAHQIMYEYVNAGTRPRRALAIPADQHLPDTPLAGATWRLLGGHADGTYVDRDDDWRWNAHYALFSAESLTDALRRAGFTIERMRHNAHPNLLCDARRQ